MKPDAPSSEWSAQEVLAQLRAKTDKGKPVSAQVFLHDDTSAEDLSRVAKKIISAAKKKVGKQAAAELGKVYRLAKSFSIEADMETLTAVANTPEVKTILPSDVSDIFPKPHDVKSV
jgi:hypothetical protein